MYFLALATDYDGTIAHDGTVDADTLQALKRFKETGRKLILVTGREMPDLKRVFPEPKIFDRIVAENGALIHDPATEEERTVAPPPPPAFVETLKARGVGPISVGKCIVATWVPHENTVLEVIRDMGLELQIIFNKGAVMILPAGINKAVGLAAALKELDLAAANVVGVGDAENDHAFLRACGCAAAVANALPAVKDDADVQLGADHGAGVTQLVNTICRDDGAIVRPERHGLMLGHDAAEQPVYLEPHRGAVLIAGNSGAGKSTLATALTERMTEKSLEFCILDPEGDYASLENAICIGDAKNAPSAEEAMALVQKRACNVVVNTQAMTMTERPEFFAKLLPQLAALRASTGRPHWLVIDEAHHLLGASRENVGELLPERLNGTIFITVHPDMVSAEALKTVRYMIGVGEQGSRALSVFCRAVRDTRLADLPQSQAGEIVFYDRAANAPPRTLKPVRPKQEHKRHTRKYAEGEFGVDSCFYFRGPQNRLNLRAQNLTLFAQIAEGVDEDTWEHHRRRGEYSKWFREVIHDDDLAREAAGIESDDALDANDSRKRIVEAIGERYTIGTRGQDD